MSGMSILAIDPGETTGLAWCDTLELTLGGAMDERFSERADWGQVVGTVGEQIWKISKGVRRVDAKVLVSENSDHFLTRPGKGLSKHALSPIKMEGGLLAMQYAMSKGSLKPIVMVKQNPNDAKGVVTDEILKAYGFQWKRAERHQADAMRHLILFIRRYQESLRNETGFAKQFARIVY